MLYCNGYYGICKEVSKIVYNFVLGCWEFESFKLGFVGENAVKKRLPPGGNSRVAGGGECVMSDLDMFYLEKH